jgi:glucosamine-6-phosphate deaminase
MLIVQTKDYNEMSKRACEIIIDEMNRKPDIVLGFATGSTPEGLYKNLIVEYKKKKVDFSKAISFNLDEYYPIKKESKDSYFYYMHRKLFDSININKKNIHILNGEEKNWKKECQEYEEKIRKTPIDIQIIGVGVNGHVAFNEPGSNKNSKTRLVELTPETIDINSRFFKKNKEAVPRNALSMGISTIMSAKKIILLANGKNKANAIKRLIKGPIGKDCPISYFKDHKNLIVIIDNEAWSLLKIS